MRGKKFHWFFFMENEKNGLAFVRGSTGKFGKKKKPEVRKVSECAQNRDLCLYFFLFEAIVIFLKSKKFNLKKKHLQLSCN